MPREFQEVLPVNSIVAQSESAEPAVRFWDYFGVTASFLCLLDCVVLPVVSSLMVMADMLPLLDVHLWLYPAILISAALAFSRSYRRHKNHIILSLAAGGCSCLLAGVFLPQGTLSAVVSVLGSLALLVAHGLNLYHFRKHPQCRHG